MMVQTHQSQNPMQWGQLPMPNLVGSVIPDIGFPSPRVMNSQASNFTPEYLEAKQYFDSPPPLSTDFSSLTNQSSGSDEKFIDKLFESKTFRPAQRKIRVELCKNWHVNTPGSCKYGAKCLFAHS